MDKIRRLAAKVAGFGLVLASFAALNSPALAQAQAGGATAVQEPVSGPPPIRADPSAIDFGFIGIGESRKATVKLTNGGSAPVRILAVQASCSCTTTSDLSGREIPPGGAVTFDATLGAAMVPGPRHATIKVLADGYSRVLEVEVRGEVALSLRAVPSAITPPPQGAERGRVVVESVDRRPFTILSSNGAKPQFLGFEPGRDAPRATYVLRTDLASLPRDRWPAFWLVETDRSDCPVLGLRVRDERFNVAPVLRMREYALNLGAPSPGQSREFTLGIADALEGECTAVGSPSLAAEVISTRPVADGFEAVVRLTPSTAVTGAFNDRFELRLGVRTQVMQAYGVVRGAAAPAPAAAPAQR
jgi:Protein of unknown function (DUF1573)